MAILTDDIDSILGNTPSVQSKPQSSIDYIDSVLNEPKPKFEDDLATDIENTLQIKPMDFTDKVSFAIDTGLNIPNNIINSVAKAISGSDKTAEDTMLDNVINFTNQYNQNYTEKYSKFAESNAPAGLLPFSLPGIKVKDVQGVSSNLGSTLTTLIAGIGAGAAASPTGPIGMGAAAGAAGGATAYRMAVSDFSDNLKTFFNAESQKKNGRDMTQPEWDEIRNKYETDALKYGLWEAVPEAVGTAVTLGVGKMVVSTAKNALKTPLMKAAKTLGGFLGEAGTEVGTETATQFGQSGVQADVFGTPKQTLSESFQSVVRPTLAMTVAGMPIGLGGGIVQNKIQQLIDKKLNIQQFTDIVPVENGTPDNSVLYTWAIQNKDKADTLVSKETPSRSDIENAFGQKFRTTSEERNYISQALKSFDYKQASQTIEEEQTNAEETGTQTQEGSQAEGIVQGEIGSVRVRNPEQIKEDEKTVEFYTNKINNAEDLNQDDVNNINNLPPEQAKQLIDTYEGYKQAASIIENKILNREEATQEDQQIIDNIPDAYQARLLEIKNQVEANQPIVEQPTKQVIEQPVEQPTVRQQPIPIPETVHKPKIGRKKKPVVEQPKPTISENQFVTLPVETEETVSENAQVEQPTPQAEPQPTPQAETQFKDINPFNDKELTSALEDRSKEFTVSLEMPDGTHTFKAEVSEDPTVTSRIYTETANGQTRRFSTKNVFQNYLKNKITEYKKSKLKPVKKAPKGFQASFRSAANEKIEQREGVSTAFKLFDEVKKLVAKYAGKFGNARIKQLGNAAGLYSQSTGNIYIKATNDIITAAHEVAHHFDETKKIFSELMHYDGPDKNKMKIKYNWSKGNPIYTRLRQMYQDEYGGVSDPKRKRHSPVKQLKEGFATLIERLIAEPTRIDSQYPDLVSWLNGLNLEDLNEFIGDSNTIIASYQGLSPEDQTRAIMMTKESRIYSKKYIQFLSDRGFIGPNFADKLERLSQPGGFRQTFVNMVARFEELEHQYLGTNALTNTLHAYRYANGIISRNVYDKGMYQILDGKTYKKVLDFSIQDLFKSVEKTALDNKVDMDRFSELLINRRILGDYEKLDKLKAENAPQEQIDNQSSIISNNRIKRENALSVVNKYSKMFSKELKMHDDITGARLDMLYASGLISKEQRDEWKADKTYTSFQRYFFQNHVTDEFKQSHITWSQKIGSTKKRVGDYNPIYAPLEGLIDSEIEMQRKAIRQVIYNSFEPLMKRMGIEAYKGERYENDKEYIVTMNNGKPTSWKVGSEMKSMLNSIIHPAQAGMIERMFTTIAKIKTVGTTALYAPFAFVNPLIDQVSAFINSENDYNPIKAWGETINKVYIEKNPQWASFANEYDRVAGASHTIFGLYDRDPETRRKYVLGEVEGLKKYVTNATEWMHKGLDLVSMPVQFSETMTRKSEYIKARLNGKDMFTALEDAGSVSTPFHHMGGSTSLRAIVRALPFFNASIQVLDMTNKAFFGRNPKQRKKAILALSLLSSTMALGVASVMGFGSEESKKLLLSKTPEELSRYIFFPSLTGGGLWQVRVPENLTPIATLFNMGLLEIFGGADYKLDEWLQGVTSWVPAQLNPLEMQQMLISWMPQLMKPLVEVMMDKKTYPDIRDLTPYSLKDLPKRLQRTDYSTWIAKAGSNILPLSPIQIDHLIEGYLGRATRPLTGKWESFMSNPFYSDWTYFTSGRIIQNYYDSATKVKAEINAIKEGKLNPKDIDINYLNKLNKFNGYVKSIDKILKIYRGVPKEKLKNPESIKLRNDILDLIDKANEV